MFLYNDLVLIGFTQTGCTEEQLLVSERAIVNMSPTNFNKGELAIDCSYWVSNSRDEQCKAGGGLTTFTGWALQSRMMSWSRRSLIKGDVTKGVSLSVMSWVKGAWNKSKRLLPIHEDDAASEILHPYINTALLCSIKKHTLSYNSWAEPAAFS